MQWKEMLYKNEDEESSESYWLFSAVFVFAFVSALALMTWWYSVFKSLSQNVKKGWAKLVLMPCGWWWISWLRCKD